MSDRIGRLLAKGRFEVTQWIGGDEWRGVACAVERATGEAVRVVFAGEPAISVAEVEARLTRDVVGLAPVVYFGAVDSDDGWGERGVMMVEAVPRGPSLAEDARVFDERGVRSLGAKIVERLVELHRVMAPLGTLRPEGVFLDDGGEVTLAIRGERLWSLARPVSSGTAPPWPVGYAAPEVVLARRLDLAPSADVFSLGVILAEKLLRRFPFVRGEMMEVIAAQLKGEHASMPMTPFGWLLARALSATPSVRPSLAEMARVLR